MPNKAGVNRKAMMNSNEHHTGLSNAAMLLAILSCCEIKGQIGDIA